MIDIDHETKSAYSENLNIPGDEIVLTEPSMDQIETKLRSPNLTGTLTPLFLSHLHRLSCLVYLDVDKIEFER